jgi:SAM-dependent methyltransferase
MKDPVGEAHCSRLVRVTGHPVLRRALEEARYQARLVLRCLLFIYFPIISGLVLLHFPYDTDPSTAGGQIAPSADAAPASSASSRRSGSFYEAAYGPEATKKRGIDYEATAKAAAEEVGIEGRVRKFVANYGLEGKRVLEVGSGRGYLQDVVVDYTGLDLSASVAGHYHKPFVVGSATRMPFETSSYDAIWSVWVLEHIAEPERALLEMRRVLKPRGLLFLFVAWDCTSWAADGFDVRPYSDFNWRGKLVKASLPVRRSGWFHFLYSAPIRAIRWAEYGLAGDATSLRFRALTSNYDVYWEPDSDAAISLDSFETYLWFRARADECVNCGNPSDAWQNIQNPLIIRISK